MSPRTQWPPVFLNGRSLKPPRLPRTGRPAKLTNRGRRALVREVTKNSMVTDRAPESLCGMGETSRKTTVSAALHQSGLYGRVARQKQSLSKRHMTQLKDSQTRRTKIKLFGLNAKHHVWRNPGTISTVKYGGGKRHAVGMCFSGRDWETSQDRGKAEWSKVQRNP